MQKSDRGSDFLLDFLKSGSTALPWTHPKIFIFSQKNIFEQEVPKGGEGGPAIWEKIPNNPVFFFECPPYGQMNLIATQIRASPPSSSNSQQGVTTCKLAFCLKMFVKKIMHKYFCNRN